MKATPQEAENSIGDYLPFYMGQKCVFVDQDGNDHEYELDEEVLYKFGRAAKQLILRPLSSMTDTEKDEYRFIDRKGSTQNILPTIKASRVLHYHHSSRSCFVTKWLLEKGFDIFNLKTKGFAVYESDLEKPTEYNN